MHKLGTDAAAKCHKKEIAIGPKILYDTQYFHMFGDFKQAPEQLISTVTKLH